MKVITLCSKLALDTRLGRGSLGTDLLSELNAKSAPSAQDPSEPLA